MTLLMPEHKIADTEGSSIPSHLKDYICKASREPGYAHMNSDGTLYCNSCGWVTPEPVVTAYSPESGNTYLTWEELVEAEANGYVVVGLSDRPGTAPGVIGPWPPTEAGKREARNAQARLRAKWKREDAPAKVRTFIRLLWPEKTFSAKH
jgi:hypothetical protein